MLRALLVPLLLAPVIACSSTRDPAAAPASAPARAPALDPIEALRADVAALEARQESEAERVKVQHILISFQGVPRVPATRSKEEAEALTADLVAQLKSGADFTQLMSRYSDDDKEVGQYLMTASAPTSPPASYNRHDMVPAFGNVGWRLKVGEVGVAPYDLKTSPYGWHIVKRLE